MYCEWNEFKFICSLSWKQTHLPGYVDDFDKFKASNDSMNLFLF